MRRIAKVIFYNKDKFLIQQRDTHLNKYPDIWTLFGGNINENETPEETLKRELMEELNYEIIEIQFLFTKVRMQDGEKVEDNIFAGEVGESILKYELLEGQDMKFVTIDELDDYKIFPVFKKYILDYNKSNNF